MPSETVQSENERQAAKDRGAILREWLVYVMEQTKLRPTPLAKQAKIAPSTILRALEDDERAAGLDLETIDKIIAAYKVAGPPIFERPHHGGNGFAEPELEFCGATLDESRAPYDFFDITATQGVWQVRTRVLELAGIVPGDRLLADSAVVARPRDIVVAQLVEMSRPSAETVLRVFDPPFLLTETNDDHARRKPLIVDADRVSIWGVVVRRLWVRTA